ncbi:MAG: 4-demethylwyosine synthase TYW1 [Candidatus Syntrophoarchaeum sp.]|nr:4-demethylwyosine synthase TYW1 [Candidatus Syntrophoarchaeum sp.]
MEPKATLSYDEGEETKRTLERQGYHFVGTQKHSAVKTCLWLWKSIRGEGNCYKGKFYGISAHRCVQMTPSIFCNQRCVHCWRPLEAFNINIDTGTETELKKQSIGWDSPEEIVEGCIKEQKRLISGFKGSPKTNKDAFAEAEVPKHAAISLIGEPTLYPYLKELIQEFHSQGMTTFVVTNGTNPEVLREISPSQLYLSLNAPDEAIYKKVAHADYWSRINESLDELRRKKGRTRTVIRITCIEGLNMVNPDGYAELLKRANTDFVEVKAYMHIGYSRKRLSRNAMPAHSRVKEFAGEIADRLASSDSEYKIVDESEISRVVLISNLSSGKKALPTTFY